MFSTSLYAEENEGQTNSDLRRFYHFQLIKITNSNKFEYNSEIYRKGMFGISRDFKDILSTYPDSKESLSSYSKLNITGNVIYWGSVASYLGFIIGTAQTTNYQEYYKNVSIGAGVFLGGVLISSIILGIANGKLYESINTYNKNKITEFK
jgi:hypothetical protein